VALKTISRIAQHRVIADVIKVRVGAVVSIAFVPIVVVTKVRTKNTKHVKDKKDR
jgi:hypothetical protein